ncbi:hypothetical protein ABZ299_04480 [Streptomyces sp. NPDC006184]|uniref:hypothetical protein n=1 Tax=Streptomyces sp. NPDC006184 TaxID=3155455 RepID=UPI0033B32AFD
MTAAEAGRWDGPVSDDVSGDVSDRVLLADRYAGMAVRGRESGTVPGVIPRGDLAARRFGRPFSDVFRNP